jgi:phosphohistidine phosphatase SixA
MRTARITLIALMLAAASTGAASAALSPEQRCDELRWRAVARSTVLHLGCLTRAARSGGSPAAGCVARAETRLARSLARAEARGGCAVDADAEVGGELVDAAVADVGTLLVTGPSKDRCAGLKLRATAVAAAARIGCHRRAIVRGGAPEQSCLDAAAAGLLIGFQRAEQRLSCNTTADAEDVTTRVIAFVEETAAWIAGSAVPPTPTALAAVVDGAEIDLTWMHPDPDEGFTHARLLRRLNTAPTGPNDTMADVVFFGAGEAATDDLTALLPNVPETARTYHYAVFACNGDGSSCGSMASRTTLEPTLVQALRAGGYTIHWRHASANVCSDSTHLGNAMTTMVPDWWKSCDDNCATATARQLNAAGRNESIVIGDQLRARGIEFDKVISSEFCRNFETAALMDLGPVVEESPLVTFFVYDEANRCADSYALLAVEPAAGKNTALIGHSGNVCAVLASLAWAEAAIFKPDGIGGTTLVTRVLWSAWAGL